MDSSMGSMDMPITSTGMAMGTATGSAAMASSTGMSMGGMDMGGNSCKISMLWNWYTVDSCFLSSSWHNKSRAMFAGSCIGVIFLVVCLEFLRRAGKEYDRYIISQYTRSLSSSTPTPAPPLLNSSNSSNAAKQRATSTTARAAASDQIFRPNVLQQSIRALLHMLQFAVAYFVMLLAMYYNGYIIICIFIGAYLGYFIFCWENFNVRKEGRDRLEENVTVCCG